MARAVNYSRFSRYAISCPGDSPRDGAAWESYSYDANGNRTRWSDPWGSGTATYDAQDRLLTALDRSYTYTANGELATKSQGGQTNTYAYDVLGNLRSVTLADGTQIAYQIDGWNRRIGKSVGGTLVQGFLYGTGPTPLAELDGAGKIVSQFLYGTSRVPDALIQNSVTYRLVTDSLGSVRWVLNATTGEVAQCLDYDAFGRVLLDTNPGFQPFGFAGGLYDPQTGLVRFGARDYDPETGRWTSKDPLLFDGGDSDLYGYAADDPVNQADPSGTEAGVCYPAQLGLGDCKGDLSKRDALTLIGLGTLPFGGPAVVEGGEWLYTLGVACYLNPACTMTILEVLNPNPGPIAPGSGAGSAAKGALLRQQLAAEEVAGAQLPRSVSGYTRHGLNQVISREGTGVSPNAILDAWNNPLGITGQVGRFGGAFKISGRKATIVLNPQGQIVTAWPSSSAGFRVNP